MNLPSAAGAFWSPAFHATSFRRSPAKARFSGIDTPCPLSAAAQNALDGHCAHCDRHVHRLDTLSEPARRALLADVDGPIRVSCRRPPTRSASRVGTAIAATLIVASGLAQAGTPASDAPSAPQPGTQADATASPPSVRDAIAAMENDGRAPRLDDAVLLGGVSEPGDADWIDDDDPAPSLPMRDPAVAGRDGGG